jgi:hypothetical protein
MKRIFFFCSLILILFALMRSASPVLGTPPQQSLNAWTGAYYANRNLQGEAVLVRDDANIDFSWGTSAPVAGIASDGFSVRWTRWYFIDTPGNWTFTTITDDGVRLFVDNALVIDAWSEQPLTTRSVTLNLSPSFHLIRLEYFEHIGNAEAHLFITSANYPDWRGEYYNNVTFTGAPAFVRNDHAIDFNFGTGGPGGNIAGTNFAVRWTRAQAFNAGRYRFTTNTDDGVRLWIDGQLLIDQWKDQTLKSFSAETNLSEGTHWLRMDYYQRGGSAAASLTWTPVQGTAEIWHGEYFANPSLDGTPVLTRDDADIDFDWGTDAPGRGINKSGNWSVRWTSKRTTLLPGYFTVIGTGDDGFRIWVDNNLLIDEWHDQPPTPHAAMVYLTAGQHDWRVEYYQHSGTASMRMDILRGAVEPATLPATQTGLPPSGITIDSKSVGFVRNLDSSWQTNQKSGGGVAYTTKNNTFTQTNSNWVRWYPWLTQPGEYEIFAFVPANLATTRSAHYIILHAGTFDAYTLNQSLYADQWVSLGKYYFAATRDEHVLLSDVTYEPAQSTLVVADALKFVPR